MATDSQSIGALLRNVALRTGFVAGVSVSAIFIVWLWVANRMLTLQTYPLARNICAGAAALLLMAIPVLRFRRQPGTMFVSGVMAWSLLTLTYMAMELFYTLLGPRMSALHVFMMGAVCYGFLAVLIWVFQICVQARQKFVSQSVASVAHPPRRSS